MRTFHTVGNLRYWWRDTFTILMFLARTASIPVSSLAIESKAVFLQGGVGKTLSAFVF